MTTKISADNIQSTTLATIGSGPKITQILICDSSYNTLDDTAIALTGGYIKIIGSGFKTGATVAINKTSASSVTFVSATEIRAQVTAQIAGSYIVYVVNSDSGVALRVNGLTYSSEPAWVSSGTLAGVSGTAISVQLDATSAAIYTVQAGSTLPAGLTLSSSGLLSGTVTVSTETLYNFNIVATDAELQDSPRAFSITITAGDIYFNSTTLLLSGNANTFVRDASTNNFAVTVVGDTKPTNFNPYLSNWSNYFDGTGDYLLLPNNAAFSFTDDFTMEAWVYATAFGTANSIIAQWQTGGLSFIIKVTGNRVRFEGRPSGTTIIVTGTTTTVNLNTWTHIAVTRSGSTVRLFVDGVLDATTGTVSGTLVSGNDFTVGALNSTAEYWNGYLSNVRVVKGTAVYTANFTPSIAPLTAIAGTSLLTCQSNRIIDTSTNNFAITKAGDTKVESYSPFVEPVTTRGSTYFDGTGDYITLPSGNPALQVGSSDFTVEAWVYPTAFTSNGNPIVALDVNGSWYAALRLGYESTGQISVYMSSSGSSWVLNSSTGFGSLTLNTWQHVALCKSGTSVTVFLNGVQQGSARTLASATLMTSTNNWIGYLNAPSAQYINAYINDWRLIKGTAVYTVNFTPPTQPLTAITNTSLLTLQNNTPVANNTFLDSSSNNLLVTRAGNATQGTFSPYSPSGWSVFFNGSTDFFNSSGGTGIGGTAMAYGTGNFTWEMWVYPTSSTWTSGNFYILDHGQNNGVIQYNGNQLRYYNTTVGGQDLAAGLVPANTWTHIAVCRISGTTRIYINGVVQLTKTGDTYDYGTSVQLWVARYGGGGYNFPGYISNLRLVKGLGVYTGAFTPSTTPLTAAQPAGTNIAAITNQTSLLICQDNSFINDSFVPLKFDGGTTLAIGGTPRVANFSPFKAVVQTPVSYSSYFDGTGDYLATPVSDAFTFGTGPFTIEAWINPAIRPPSTVQWIYGNITTASGNTQIGISITTTGLMQLQTWNSILTITTSAIPLNAWTHVAAAFDGTTYKLFINGILSASSTTIFTLSGNGSGTVGYNGAVAGNQLFTGHISNLRIVKGTAVYTANFTPPTQPLTAITNTSLLTCQSPTFTDNSTNKFAITAAGNTQPTTVNPFGSTFTNSTGYTAAEYSGSMYFTNKTDYLAIPATKTLTTFPGNFTFECWVYPTNAAVTYWNIWDARQTGGSAAAMIFSLYPLATAVSGSYRMNYYNGTSYNGTGVVVMNQWTHVAYVRVGTTLTFYINGVASGTATVSGTQTATATTNPIYIGSKDSNLAQYGTVGYISNLRVNNGTALYTSNFVPPLAPVLPVTNTPLLLNGTSSAITDVTTKNDLETLGDAKISTAVSKFGGSSMSFDGSADRLSVIDNPNINLGSGEFTLECWVYFNVVNAEMCLISKGWQSSSAYASYAIYMTSTGSLRFLASSSGSGWDIANDLSIGTATAGVWTHIAVTRSGSTFRAFVNGVINNSFTFTSALSLANIAAQTLFIGGRTDGNSIMNGYMQDVRITKGIARYTESFTPPTSALPTK